jgi:hypothetical protein
MTAAVPDWLVARGGDLRPAVDADTWLFLLDGSPQYKLVIAPAQGQVTCVITQTNNGRRLDRGAIYSMAEAALEGGLAELREILGW